MAKRKEKRKYFIHSDKVLMTVLKKMGPLILNNNINSNLEGKEREKLHKKKLFLALWHSYYNNLTSWI